MKLREVLRYELAHRLRSSSTWVYAALRFGLGFFTLVANGDARAAVNVNAPARLAGSRCSRA